MPCRVPSCQCMRAVYRLSVMSFKFDLSYSTVISVPYVISWWIAVHYKGTWLYHVINIHNAYLIQTIYWNIFMMQIYGYDSKNIYEYGITLNTRQFIHPCIFSIKCMHEYLLTPWCRVTYICICKLTIIDSDDGLLPGPHQIIIWTIAGIFLIGSQDVNFREILIQIHAFSFKKMHLNVLWVKWQPFCLSLNVLKMEQPYHIKI